MIWIISLSSISACVVFIYTTAVNCQEMSIICVGKVNKNPIKPYWAYRNIFFVACLQLLWRILATVLYGTLQGKILKILVGNNFFSKFDSLALLYERHKYNGIYIFCKLLKILQIFYNCQLYQGVHNNKTIHWYCFSKNRITFIIIYISGSKFKFSYYQH